MVEGPARTVPTMMPSEVGQRQLEDESDGALVDFAVAGNRAAFDVLVRRYRSAMLAHAARTLGSSADSDDVVQESLIVAWEKLPTITDPAHVKAWLMRVVHNKSVDRLRRRGPRPAALDEDTLASDASSPFAVVETLLQNDALARALAELPHDQRRAWLMREFSGSSYALIASELGVPVSTVRGLLARSRRTLAQELVDWR